MVLGHVWLVVGLLQSMMVDLLEKPEGSLKREGITPYFLFFRLFRKKI